MVEKTVNSPSSKAQCLDCIPSDHYDLTKLKKQISKTLVKKNSLEY